jgi:hypothetical protein
MILWLLELVDALLRRKEQRDREKVDDARKWLRKELEHEEQKREDGTG